MQGTIPAEANREGHQYETPSQGAHSPAPWVVAYGASGYPRGINAPNEMKIPGAVGCIVRWNGIGCPSSRTAQANAHLIAAAPDMLEALTRLVNMLRADGWSDNYRPMAEALRTIAKATGAQS